MCKKFVLGLIVATVLSLSLGGCASMKAPAPKEGASAPLQTEGNVRPPKGCEEFRERGGAC
jgi:hypothetical protein